VNERPSARQVFLLDAEPDLGGLLSAAELSTARTQLVARVMSGGSGDGPVLGHASSQSASVILAQGFLLRETALGNRRSAQLMGPGDILSPFGGHGAAPEAVPAWRFLTDADLIVLGERELAQLSAWPAVTAALLQRWAVQAERASLQLDIVKQAHIEVRVMLMLWHFAQRWGRVLPGGILLPLPLTHQLLGQLVGSRRPTVSLAVKHLERDGVLSRTDGGAWLLDERFLSESVAPMPVRPAAVPRTRTLPPAVDGLRPDLDRLRRRLGALRTAHAASALRTSETLQRCEMTRRDLALRRRATAER
jgi:CRP-like cAMP-binding protein